MKFYYLPNPGIINTFGATTTFQQILICLMTSIFLKGQSFWKEYSDNFAP
jgi:hypothetical protein